MPSPVDVHVYFNFRSPYCYLASKTMWPIFDRFHANLVWRPVGGWDLRSDPDRVKKKLPLARQDMARYARRLGIPVTPPPLESEPTAAGAGSFYAEREGKLREYIVEMMREEWEYGKNIALDVSLVNVAKRIGLCAETLLAESKNSDNRQRLVENAVLADSEGVIGVPSFVIGDQIFWGQDRIDFVLEHLTELRLARL